MTILWELAAAVPDLYRPDLYGPDLAGSLNNLCNRLAEMGRTADALPPAQEAVAIRRKLAAAMPDRYRLELAISLNNLSDVLTALGRDDDAAASRSQAGALSDGALTNLDSTVRQLS